MTKWKVTNALDLSKTVVEAETAAEAVRIAESARTGRPLAGLQASHYSRGNIIDVACGDSVCRGLRERVSD